MITTINEFKNTINGKNADMIIDEIIRDKFKDTKDKTARAVLAEHTEHGANTEKFNKLAIRFIEEVIAKHPELTRKDVDKVFRFLLY